MRVGRRQLAVAKEFEFGWSLHNRSKLFAPKIDITGTGKRRPGPRSVWLPPSGHKTGLHEQTGLQTPRLTGFHQPTGIDSLESDEKIPFRDLRKPFTIRGLAGFDSIDE